MSDALALQICYHIVMKESLSGERCPRRSGIHMKLTYIELRMEVHMNILFIGDIVGRPGRNYLSGNLEKIINKHSIDFVIANGENSAGGGRHYQKNL